MKTIDLFGLDLVDASPSEATGALMCAPRGTANFVNAHCVNTAMADDVYAATLKNSDMLLPDGSGMALAARMTGRRFTANLNGTDLFLPICRAAREHDRSIFLLGARPGIAEAAARAAGATVPGLRIAGTRDGYYAASDTDAVIDEINRSGADILLVAMGVPLQEKWLARHRDTLAPRLVMGVGAQFDFFAGRISRAPVSLREAGCEWIWRLGLEPRRMAKRYLWGNPLFMARAAKHAAGWHARRLDGVALAKRALDLAVAGGATIALSPLFALTAAAIRIESPGPVFFAQTRVGQNGRHFRILKFRSMYRDAEARRAALLAQSDREGVCFKARRDPRITRIGRWLRRFSIDELPQLLNVLKGDMSLVGPRPALSEEVAAYPDRARGRLVAKPGITGVWQVSGRADICFDRMIDMDLAYARSRSVWLDLALLALTGRAVLSGRGAY